MAVVGKAIRIDAVTELPNGSVNVAYTAGQPPLPVEPSGSGIGFATRADMFEFMSSASDALTDAVMIALSLSGWFAADRGMRDLSSAAGKVATVDLGGGSASWSSNTP